MARASGPSQARLQADFETGRAIAYRKVPGTRTYYDPLRPTMKPVTEDYVIRVYNPALKTHPVLQESVQELRQKYQTKERKRRHSVRDAYRSRNKPDPFIERMMYNELRSYTYRQRSLPLGPDRDAFLAADGEFATFLVDIGFRDPDATYDVGGSPRRR